MRPLHFLFPLLLCLPAWGQEAKIDLEQPAVTLVKLPQQLDVFVSTGDNHFLGSSLPIDSPASIEATFDLFQHANHVRRVYWRGHEEANWIETMEARSENPRYYSLWTWLQWLYANVHPDELAVKAAHDRDMEIWGVGTMFDWGGPADTPTFGDYPFPFESKLKREHPEWAPVDKHGARRQGGPIELAYPEARKALAELQARETLRSGYDGLTLLTYAENYSMRFQDEFGFSDPIVADFQKAFGSDLRRQPFRRGASQEDWLRLRGSYVTAYLRELHAALAPHGKKLGVILNGNDIHAPQTWNVPELMLTAGAMHMDVETWVREGLVDSLAVYGNCSGAAQMKAVQDVLFLCRGTGVEVSLITSSPLDPSREPLYACGVRGLMAVSDDAQHLARSFVPEQTASALQGDNLWARLKALELAGAGKLSAQFEALAPLVQSKSLIERRMALLALAKLPPEEEPRVAPLLEAALDDAENGVRCVAALALGQRAQAASWRLLLRAVEQHGNHMLEECAVIALRKLKPLPAVELAEALAKRQAPAVRRCAARTLQLFPTTDLVPVFRAALADADRFTAVAAAEALGNLRKSNAGALPLIGALSHQDPAVGARAAVSLGVIAARNEKETATVRGRMLAALKVGFERFGRGCTRPDADWGYRPVGNALRAFGEEGEAALRQLRDQSVDPVLADLAWRVLDLHQQPNTFSEVSEPENEAAFSRRPGTTSNPPPAGATVPAGRALHVDPANGDDHGDAVAKPCKTIARAIALAQPGDTIHLAPATYYEMADFTNKHGELGRPITLDGHGTVLDGSEPVRGAEWEQVSPGLFRKMHLLSRIDDAMIGRWFFLWNGRMNHMGRTSKGPSAKFKKPEELQPEEWTYVASEEAFYLRLPPGQELEAANIRYPARPAGVEESLTCSHITVRNVTATHVYNDGFNIHGLTRDCRFENIASIDCGDDGFSAHDDCQCEIDGFVSIGNSTGLADVGASVTHYRLLVIRDCLGFDLLIYGDGAHSITDGVILSSANTPLGLDPSSGAGRRGVSLKMQNVLFRRTGAAAPMRVGKDSLLEAERCTFEGASLVASGGQVRLQRCIFTGPPKPTIEVRPGALWAGSKNLYDLQELRLDKGTYNAESFDVFRQLLRTEEGSRWGEAKEQPETGADLATLRKMVGELPAAKGVAP